MPFNPSAEADGKREDEGALGIVYPKLYLSLQGH